MGLSLHNNKMILLYSSDNRLFLPQLSTGSGGGRFFLACKTFGGKIWWMISCQHFSSPPPFFFWWGSAHSHQFNSLCQDQFTVAHQAEMTTDKHSLRSCMSWSPWEVSTLYLTAQSAHSTGSRVERVTYCGVTICMLSNSYPLHGCNSK